MPKPWEQYQTTEAKPWEQYAQPVAAPIVEPIEPETPQDFSFGEMVSNIPRSAYDVGANIVSAFAHPVQTGEALAGVSIGAAEKARRKMIEALPETIRGEVLRKFSLPGEDVRLTDGEVPVSEREAQAEAMGQFIQDRYGSTEAFQQTLMQDPVGVMADASMVLTAGGAGAVRIPGIAGKVGEAAGKVGRAIDPVRMVAKDAGSAAKFIGKGTADIIGGLGTHTGGESLRKAAAAGLAGGKKAEDFREAMRGVSAAEDVVTDAKMALSNMRQERSVAYRAGMADIAKDKTVLDFDPINQAIIDVEKIGKFKGVSISKSTAKTMQKIKGVIDEWRGYDPADFHTPEGMDALKRALGDIRDSTELRTPSRTMADKAYNAVKGQIVQQAPEYAKIMSGYEKGVMLVKEIEKTLSAGGKAPIDTTLRKLQSVMRDNANTNYGQRVKLAETLVEAGAPNLMEKLAGQSLRSVTPRGLGKAVAGAGGLAGASAVGAGTISPAALIPLAATSPRLMGEAAYYGGRAAAPVSGAVTQLEQLLNRAGLTSRGVAAGGFQAGRLEDQTSSRSNR